MPTYETPGVHLEEPSVPVGAELRTGVPAFLGFAAKGPVATPDNAASQALTLWSDFEGRFGEAPPGSYLSYSVRAFFANEGELCYVLRLDDDRDAVGALEQGLDALACLDTIDLVCAPDVMRLRQPGNLKPDKQEIRSMQDAILKHCDDLGDRFALLDSVPSDTLGEEQNDVVKQRRGLNATNGALYFPWIRLSTDPNAEVPFVPPCGHIAGAYARSDRKSGVFKAPANEELFGALDLECIVDDVEQQRLNREGVNCIRAFPGRGIRIWGARTLSRDSVWKYISVRRLFLTVHRQIERRMAPFVLEPNDPRLWGRIIRELTAYFNSLFRSGALAGSTAQEAFYVKCDEETNPPSLRDLGQVVAEIGLAAAIPNEFVVVRVVQNAAGLSLSALDGME